jgi:anti-sigma B factor antagonist
MDVRTVSLRDMLLLETQGDIDHSTCAGLESALDDALGAGSKVVLLDLTQVTYIDSGGLSVLFCFLRQLREDGWMGLIGPNPNIRRLLQLVGLLADPSLRVFLDREAAEAAVANETGAG